MRNYGQVSDRLSQFYSKTKKQKPVQYATNAFETSKNNAPVFMLSQIQINHYNLIELLAFELNKQITLKFSRFSEHEKSILLLKAIKIMDELQKLCCSIKIDYIYDIFFKIMTCLGTLAFSSFSKVFQQEKEQQRKNRFEAKGKINKQNQGSDQFFEKNKEQQIKEIKKNKLRGIHLYNEAYARHIENRNFLSMLKQSASENKQKYHFWNELKKDYGQTSCENDKSRKNPSHSVPKQCSDDETSLNQNLHSININNVMDIVSQIYQNQKQMTLDSIKKLIYKISKMYEKRIRQLESEIIRKQQKQKKLQQFINKRTQNTKDAEVQISQFKQTSHLEKQLDKYKEKLKNSEHIMNNMEELITKLNHQNMSSEREIFLVKRKLQEKEKKCEFLSKKIDLIIKNQKQTQPEKNKKKQKQFIDCSSIFSVNKIKEEQCDVQIKESQGRNQNILKMMQKTLYQHRNMSYYNTAKNYTKSEKIIRLNQSLNMNISKNKEQNNLSRSPKKKKKLLKFNFKEKIRKMNQRNNETQNFNQKSHFVDNQNKNDSSENIENIENITSDQVKEQIFSIIKQNKAKQEIYKKAKPNQAQANKTQEKNVQNSKEKSQKRDGQKIKEEFIDSFQDNKMTEMQKQLKTDIKRRKKYKSTWILNNHDALKNDLTYNKMKSIQKVIIEQAQKIIRQSQQDQSIKKREISKTRRVQKKRTNFNNNTVFIMTNQKEQQQIDQSTNTKVRNIHKIGEERTQKQNRKQKMERKLKKLSNMHIKRNQTKLQPNLKEEQQQTGQFHKKFNKEMELEKKYVQDYKKISYASPLKKNIRQNSRAYIENQNKKYSNRKLYQTKLFNFNTNQTQDINKSQ